MKEYSPILDVYSLEGYSMYSTFIPASEWGNRQLAESYLGRYWLSWAEYDRICKQLQDQIFSHPGVGPPEMVFNPGYEVQVARGGCLFVQEEFMRLREC